MGRKNENYSNFTTNEASCVKKCLEKLQRNDDDEMQVKYVVKFFISLDNC